MSPHDNLLEISEDIGRNHVLGSLLAEVFARDTKANHAPSWLYEFIEREQRVVEARREARKGTGKAAA